MSASVVLIGLFALFLLFVYYDYLTGFSKFKFLDHKTVVGELPLEETIFEDDRNCSLLYSHMPGNIHYENNTI